MRVTLESAIAIRSEGGLSFGTLRGVNGARIIFELESPLFPGDSVEVQIELSGYGRTLNARCEIHEGLARRDSPSRYIGQMEFKNETDRYLFGEWVTQVSRGGTSQRPDQQVSSTWSRPARALSPDAVESALHRLDTRSRFPGSSAGSASSSGQRQGVGREAVRAALHAAVKPQAPRTTQDPIPRNTAPQPDPSPGSHRKDNPYASTQHSTSTSTPASQLPHPHLSRPDSSRMGSVEPSVAGRASPRDPSSTVTTPARPGTPRLPQDIALFHVEMCSQVPAVVVIYKDRSIYLRDYAQYYKQRLLFVPWLGLKPARGALVEVTITLPSSMTVMGRAEVVAELTTGFGLALRFEEVAFKLLNMASQV